MRFVKPARVVILALAIPAARIQAQGLDEHLQLMKPFTGKVWESKMQGLRGEGVMTSRREWSVIWGGKAIRYTSYTDKLDQYQEGYFFWDRDKQEIGVFTLNSMGRFQHGHVKEEDGKILVYGSLTLENATLEFRNYFEFTDDGTILDKWFSLENGEWRPGHSVELREKKTQSTGPGASGDAHTVPDLRPVPGAIPEAVLVRMLPGR